MSFDVKFWGTRGSIPTPGKATARFGGDTSCVELRIDGHEFVCDAGTGLRLLGVDLLERGEGPVVAHLFFSHSHWDHIQGFPFFDPAFLPSTEIYVYFVEPGQERLAELLSGQMETDYFPVQFSDLAARIEPRALRPGANTICGVRVSTLPLEHPGHCYGFAFERGGHKVVYATDNEIDRRLANAATVRDDLDAPRPIPADLVAFARGADLLIGDGQYTDREYEEKVGWGHSRVGTLVDFAVQAGVAQLAIYHHDPMHDDDAVDGIVDVCRARAKRMGSDLYVFGASVGSTIAID